MQWQIFDWYLKPMVSWFYIKKAGEPLHVQLNLPDNTVSVINRQLTAVPNLKVFAQVFDLDAKLLWEMNTLLSVPANAYQEAFTVPEPPNATPVSLLPGESREVAVTFAAKDAGKAKPTLEVGGWNEESDFDYVALTVTPKEIKAGERFTVTASVANTFLDGSRVALQLDGKPVAFKWAWARTGGKKSLVFPLTLDQPGRHDIAVNGQKISVTVQP